MMRKCENFLKSLTKNQTHHILERNFFFSFKKEKGIFFFQKVGTGRANPLAKKKNLFFFFLFSLIQKNTTSFILQTSITSTFKPPFVSPFFIPTHKPKPITKPTLPTQNLVQT